MHYTCTCYIVKGAPVKIVVVGGITRDDAELFAKAAKDLRREDKPPTTAESKRLHNRVHLTFKHLSKLTNTKAKLRHTYIYKTHMQN